MRTRRLVYVLCTALFFGVLSSPGSIDRSDLAWAAEQKCADLDAQFGAGTCVCSEPFNTGTYEHAILNNQWNPADSLNGQKECSQELSRHPIARNIQDIVGTNDATVMNAFPAGHTNSWALRAGNGNVGIWWIGNGLGNDCGTGWERCAFRWYVYKSTDFQYTNSGSGGTCSGDKNAEMSVGSASWIINPANQVSGDGMSGYNFISGWTPSVDCCNQGPRLASDTFISGANQKGHWTRFEVVVYNPSGGTGASRFHLEKYAQILGVDANEYKILDMEGPGTPGWAGGYTTIIPPGRAKTVAVNAYREGTCAGFEAYSHLLIAHWATNSGQRIGAAVEAEGGGTPPPSAPFNVRLTIFLLSVLGGSGGFGLYLWHITRRRIHAQPPESGDLSLGGPRPEPPRPVEVGSPADDSELVGAARDRGQK